MRGYVALYVYGRVPASWRANSGVCEEAGWQVSRRLGRRMTSRTRMQAKRSA